jgi:hypothetical protein
VSDLRTLYDRELPDSPRHGDYGHVCWEGCEMRGKPRTPEETAHLLAGFLGKPDHEGVILAAVREAVAQERTASIKAIEDWSRNSGNHVAAWFEQARAQARVEERRALREIMLPPVPPAFWTDEERDGMARVYREASEKHGH